ncbi:MAG: fused MFS/spermidine synthase [Phycisphaerales bacterium]|nr:MAG: fused MFS/spermidine synthase [Phycisphaerales bacterium]
MSKSKSSPLIIVPSATVFFSSACIMVLEIVAGRLIARHLGSSLYTWTSVIGVVLAGIAIGNYLGGRIADRFAARKALAVLFALASASCVVIVVLNNVVGEWIWLWRLSWPVRVFLHVSLVFLAPSALLGTISPVVAKMALDRGLATGRTVGNIYAWGAVGSIAGTFLAGFFLIAAFGTVAIVWTVGGAMLVMAILYWAKFWMFYVWAIAFLALVTLGVAPVAWAERAGSAAALRSEPDSSTLYEAETQYCYVAVQRISERPDTRAFVQDKLRHSEITIGNVPDLQYFYTKIYAGITHGLGRGKDNLSMMVIGGGGYAYPQYLKATWPDSDVEVVEIDPGVTEAAMAAFGLPRDTSIKTISMDARNYVDQLLQQERTGGEMKRYDFIYEDAINDYSVPFQLVTREFNDKIARILADDGVYMVNLIDMYKHAQFLGAVVNTLRETFPHVHVITAFGNLPTLRDTFVVAAAKHEFDPQATISEYNKHLKLWYLSESEIEFLREKAGNVVLTDDYAPVENMLAPVVRQSAKEILARKYLQQAKDFQAESQWEKSIAKYEAAVQLNPTMAIKTYNEIGMIQVARGNLEKGEEAFRGAIAYHESREAKESAIASVYLNLGVLLRRMGKEPEAMQQLGKAVEWFRIDLEENPGSTVVWSRLGNTLATMGDLKGASASFEKALALEPANPIHYDVLVAALEFQGRYDEAIGVLRKQIELMKQQGDQEAVVRITRHMESIEYRKSQQQE